MIWVVILIGCAVREICFNQWEWHVKYGISLADIYGETSGGFAKCWLFSKAKESSAQ